MKARSKSCGFTLPEILAATAIFAMLGAMIFSVLRGSLDVWSRGESGRDISERATTLLDRMAFELRQTYSQNPIGVGIPPVQFRCEYLGIDRDRNGQLDSRHQRIAFVRPSYEELTDPNMSVAGMDPLATEYHVGDSPSDEEISKYLPTGGLAEVSYIAWLAEGESESGSLTLFRGFRSPVGGKGSLADVDPIMGFENLGFIPIARGVLHLGFRFRMLESEGFQELAATGIENVWDSTRAHLPASESINAFGFSQAEDGAQALERTADDVYPYQIEITLVLTRTGAEARVGKLAGIVDSADKKPILALTSTRFLSDSRERPLNVKVGDEWMEVGTITSSSLQVVRRGLHDSPIVSHNPGEPVRFGTTFRRVVTLPCYRGDRSQ